MRWILDFYRSHVGKKVVMAVTGIAVFGFVLIHMIGNLKLYMGADAFNAYAVFLREVGKPLFGKGQLLWVFRIGLIGAFALHMLAAWSVTRQNWAARPVKYAKKKSVQMGYAERTMRWGGVIMGLFVLYHLAHFTWGFKWAHASFVPNDVYHNVVTGFKVWWVSGIYIVAQVFLGLHLYHGLWSLFQSLGLSGKTSANDWRRIFAAAFAGLIAVGNISYPVSVLMGVVK